jgi:hypothetical protein
MEWLYWAAGVFFAWAAFSRAELWLARFINAQQRQADGLHSVAGALLKRIEWEAACRRTDAAEAQVRAAFEQAQKVREALREQRKLEVHDDLNLAPAAQSLLGKLAARVPPSEPLGGGHTVTEYKVTLSGPKKDEAT